MFTPTAAAAPTYTLSEQSDNTALVPEKAPTPPGRLKTAPSRTIVRDPSAVAYIRTEASKYGIDPELALYVWQNEGKGDLHAIGDMNLTCKRTGNPVRARGGWQITECYHPEVSDECAFDLGCSTSKALPMLKNRATCISQFSTCRDYYR